jgi:hypothetical protein
MLKSELAHALNELQTELEASAELQRDILQFARQTLSGGGSPLLNARLRELESRAFARHRSRRDRAADLVKRLTTALAADSATTQTNT